MTLRTVTYDDSKFKIVPIESTEQWIDNLIVKNGAPSIEMARSTMHGLVNELLAAAPEYKEPEHPLDTPLPCDIKIGVGTIKKGSKFSVLVHRMTVLYQMAMKAQLGIADKPEYKESERAIVNSPTTAAEIRAFIGSQFCSLKYGVECGEPSDNDLYTLTAHDLLSAFDWNQL